jgi:hypothetical protein
MKYIYIVELFIGVLLVSCVSPKSDLELANKYYLGIQCKKDVDKARKYYIKAANKQHSLEAVNMLAIMTYQGEGIAKNDTLSFRYFSQASKYAFIPAMCNLGKMYFYGIGCKQNFIKSFIYFKYPAQKEMSSACFYTGYIYLKGLAFPQSYDKALQYFRKGAQKNDTKCLYMLGYCYLHGYGVKKDKSEALAYFEKGDEVSKQKRSWASLVDSVKNKPALDHATISDIKQHRLTIGHMPEVGNSSDSHFSQDSWCGKVYTYDWSCKEIEEVDAICFELKQINDTLTGKCYINNALRFCFNAVQTKGLGMVSRRIPQYRFWHVNKLLTIDSLGLKKVSILNFSFNSDSSYLRGHISLRNKDTWENLRDRYFILDRCEKLDLHLSEKETKPLNFNPDEFSILRTPKEVEFEKKEQ